MPNEFVIKNGLIVSGTSDVSGNLVVRNSVDISGSLAVGFNLDTGLNSVAIGQTTTSSGNYSHAEGLLTIASGLGSHAEGDRTVASGIESHAEGVSTVAAGSNSHAEGFFTSASGQYAHAEGERTIASNTGAHSEGYDTKATGQYSHAEGLYGTASAQGAHVEGWSNRASAPFSHAEGHFTQASATGSHTEGDRATTLGNYSHAEGSGSVAFGAYSHAEGLLTIASGAYQNVVGQFNSASSTPLWILGDGLSISNRKNLVAAYRDNLTVSGALEVTGALSVFLAGRTEFEVSSAGTRIGNLQTDNHLITGSVGITGSTFSVFSGGVNPEFQVVGNGTRIGNLQTDVHLLTGSFGITGSLNVVGGGITSSLLGTASRAISASVADTIPTALLRGEVHVSISGSDVAGNGSAISPYRSILNAIASGSATFGAGNYTLFLHAGSYSGNITLPNVPLDIVGVQNPRTRKVSILGTMSLAITAPDLNLSNLSVSAINLRNNNFTARGCNIGSISDQVSNSETYSTLISDCNIELYEDNGYRKSIGFSNSVIQTGSYQAGVYNFNNVEHGNFQVINTQIISVRFADSTLVSDSLIGLNNSISYFNNCTIKDTTGSLQGINGTFGYTDLRFSEGLSTYYANADVIYHSLVSASQFYGPLQGTASNANTASFVSNNITNVIYVSSGSGNDSNDGTFLRPKRTIASALGSNRYVRVFPGLYREGLFTNHSNLVVEGVEVGGTGSLVTLNGLINCVGVNVKLKNLTANTMLDGGNNCTYENLILTSSIGNLQILDAIRTSTYNNVNILGTASLNSSNDIIFNNSTIGHASVAVAKTPRVVYNNSFISGSSVASGSHQFNNSTLVVQGTNPTPYRLLPGVFHSFANSRLIYSNRTPATITGSGPVDVTNSSFNVSQSNYSNLTAITQSVCDSVVFINATGSLMGTASWALTSSFAMNAGGGGGASVTVSASAPGASPSGSLWWNTDDGNLYVQANAPTGSGWVAATSTVAGGEYGATSDFSFPTAATTWNIAHNFGTTTPIVQFYTGSQMLLPASVRAVDANNLQVTFAAATHGVAKVSTGVGSATSSSYAVTAGDLILARTASYANDTAAAAAGIPLFGIYRNGGSIAVRIV
jgi:hypothetical protein